MSATEHPGSTGPQKKEIVISETANSVNASRVTKEAPMPMPASPPVTPIPKRPKR